MLSFKLFILLYSLNHYLIIFNGETFITKGYNLPAKYVIHTVGPIIYTKVTEKKESQLANCYY